MSDLLPIAIAEHQKKEEEWIHFAGYTSPRAPQRTNIPERVTCPSCIRGLKKDKFLTEK